VNGVEIDWAEFPLMDNDREEYGGVQAPLHTFPPLKQDVFSYNTSSTQPTILKSYNLIGFTSLLFYSTNIKRGYFRTGRMVPAPTFSFSYV